MSTGNRRLASDAAIVEQIHAHIANGTTDLADGTWREPVANYRSTERFIAELELVRTRAVAFCPSAALAEPGAYVSRDAAGLPVVAVRGDDGAVRAFRNVCRHRGAAVVCGAGRTTRSCVPTTDGRISSTVGCAVYRTSTAFPASSSTRMACLRSPRASFTVSCS